VQEREIMKGFSRVGLLAATSAAVIVLFSASSWALQEKSTLGTQETKPAVEKITVHGGMHYIAKQHAFEIVALKDVVHVYPYNMKAEPITVSGISGTIVITPAEGEAKTFTLNPVLNVRPGWEFLKASGDFTELTKKPFKIKAAIKGLPGTTEKDVTFDLSFASLSPVVRYVCKPCNLEVLDPGTCSKCSVKLERTIKTTQTTN
jgi:hypothetical protein